MKRKLEICEKCKHMKRDGGNARCSLFNFDCMSISRLSDCGGRYAQITHNWEKEGMSDIADWERLPVPDRTVHFKKPCALIDEYEKPFRESVKELTVLKGDDIDLFTVADFCDTQTFSKEEIVKFSHEICKTCRFMKENKAN